MSKLARMLKIAKRYCIPFLIFLVWQILKVQSTFHFTFFWFHLELQKRLVPFNFAKNCQFPTTHPSVCRTRLTALQKENPKVTFFEELQNWQLKGLVSSIWENWEIVRGAFCCTNCDWWLHCAAIWVSTIFCGNNNWPIWQKNFERRTHLQFYDCLKLT